MQNVLVDETGKNYAWLAAIPLALMCTLGLFVLMESLVRQKFVDIVPPKDIVIKDFVMPHGPVIDERFPAPVKPDPAKLPPPLVEDPGPPANPSIGVISAPSPVTDGGDMTLNMGGSSIPIARVMVQPAYPSSAIARGTEGYVVVRFDVTSAGNTDNISVIEANPKGVFERASIDAVRKWKFQPVSDSEGNTHPFSGLVEKLVFQMGES